MAQARDQEQQRYKQAWYQKQSTQDCPPRPYDESAIAAVERGLRRERSQYVHGPRNPHDGRTVQLGRLTTRPNSKGEGVIVASWEDENPMKSADYSRTRLVWLVLKGDVYPLNGHAALALGRFFGGLPNAVEKRSGLVYSHPPERTILEQLGFEEKTYERRFEGGNPFPSCR